MRKLPGLAAVAGIAVVLSGCSLTAGSPGDGDEGGKTKIVWLQWQQSELGDAPYDAVKEKFEEENPDIELEIQDMAFAQYHDKIVSLDQSGNVPDVISMPASMVIEFANSQIVDPITDRFEATDADYQEAISGPLTVTWKGDYYGLPYYIGNTAMYYNKAAFAEAGVTPPTTWAELLSVSKKLTDSASLTYAMTGNISAVPPTTVTYEVWPYFIQAGADLIVDNRAVFNDDAGIEALEFFKELNDAGVMTPGNLSAGEKEKRTNFSAENTSIMFDGPWGISIQQSANSDLDFGILPMPDGARSGSIVSGGVLGITAKGEHQDAAWKFVEFMASVEGQTLWAQNANSFPTNNVVMQADFIQGNELLKPFADQFAGGNSVAIDMFLPEATNMRTIFTTEVQSYLAGDKSAQQALDDAATQWNEILEKYDN